MSHPTSLLLVNGQVDPVAKTVRLATQIHSLDELE